LAKRTRRSRKKPRRVPTAEEVAEAKRQEERTKAVAQSLLSVSAQAVRTLGEGLGQGLGSAASRAAKRRRERRANREQSDARALRREPGDRPESPRRTPTLSDRMAIAEAEEAMRLEA